ncbi:MAG TPA: hypothetical protein VFU69_15515, partial [Ktedonobacterales bacterium]|nr:hypothetical protein [Ktedonobacterales bacterium]
LGFAWHWDLDGADMGSTAYSQMIRRLFESVGFEKMAASEPNLHMDPANIFLARIGSNVDPETVRLFRSRLNTPVTLY